MENVKRRKTKNSIFRKLQEVGEWQERIIETIGDISREGLQRAERVLMN